MAKLQIKCPETGNPVDLGDVPPLGAIVTANRFSKPVPCPHCGKEHAFTSHDRGLAMRALQGSPHASRVLVEGEPGDRSATALP